MSMGTTEPEALRSRRTILFEKIAQAADEIKRIDDRLLFLQKERE